jgi:cell fate regulator YaaT (PSP1 superfamily)
MEENNENYTSKHNVGVRFNEAGRIYYFESSAMELEVGDEVIVETATGLEMAEVAITNATELVEKLNKPLKPVVRKVTSEDRDKAEKLRLQEKEAMVECQRLVGKMKLPMKLISVRYNIDGKRLTVSFSAEGRIDFREMVRDLNRRLKVRIEMHQVGPRDEAKLLGGYGRCGRHLCCASFLSDMNPVSIKMAKEQGLPLSPMKISGLCGRLLCCLGYEFEQYRTLRQKMPKEGKPITTPMGEGIVKSINPVEETVTVELEGGNCTVITLHELNGGKETRAGEGEDKSKQKKAKAKVKNSNKDKKRGSQKRHIPKKQNA